MTYYRCNDARAPCRQPCGIGHYSMHQLEVNLSWLPETIWVESITYTCGYSHDKGELWKLTLLDFHHPKTSVVWDNQQQQEAASKEALNSSAFVCLLE